MARRISRRAFLGRVAGGLAAAQIVPLLQTRAQARSADGIVPVEVNARALVSFDLRDPSHVRFGSFQFRSGLVLTSPFRKFGGLSSLHLDAAGENFVMASDKGDWFTGRLVYNGDALSGLADVRSAPMRDRDGQPLAAKGWFDTESLTFDGSIAYVGIERVNKIVRFDFDKGGILARAEDVVAPPEIAKLPYNRGLESLVYIGKGHRLAGTILAVSERSLDARGNIAAFLIGGPSPGIFHIKRSNDFDVSDATLLPSGDVLLLERKFSLTKGVGIQVRCIPVSVIAPGSLVDGPVIFEADLGAEVDNFEGIAAHVARSGETVITLISDDNFSVIQRTLLLQFTLLDR
ncbi:esterase-like activity of phytase family protein [[Pseudomonas] carboxydohydrogena]|uniref:Esterase-like activity of phytase family protein n=1 Tax=Afipia carboxydohydrogena TaxID=290 RepID=A0ABY8BUF3_AFICR|nr:esterase-like activity of phytase family protein [[Pseudomonas] carboxydohydrogena]WEF51947.1 esterase-like activity of phytase family protein [[Pseudomonas] carboxydohydrogena]